MGALAVESVGGQVTMPLSWNEIRNRAHEFSKRWDGEWFIDHAQAKSNLLGWNLLGFADKQRID